jgi:hypothetical protein
MIGINQLRWALAQPRVAQSHRFGTIGGSMPSFQQIFPFIPLAVFAFFGWRYFRSGSLVGALLGGKLTETIGEISLSSRGLSSRVLRVSLMAAPAGESPINGFTIEAFD